MYFNSIVIQGLERKTITYEDIRRVWLKMNNQIKRSYMRTVVVITNNPKAFHFFLTQLNFRIGQSFRFVMIDTPDKLKDIQPVMYTRLSMEALHHDAEEIARTLDLRNTPHFDSFDFTKDSQEIIQYANES